MPSDAHLNSPQWGQQVPELFFHGYEKEDPRHQPGRHSEPFDWEAENASGTGVFPGAHFFEGRHRGMGPWIDLIHEVNESHRIANPKTGEEEGGFATPTVQTSPDGREYTERYPDYEVIMRGPGYDRNAPDADLQMDRHFMDPSHTVEVKGTTEVGKQHIVDAKQRLAAAAREEKRR